MESKQSLENEFVRSYYNDEIGKLDGTYTKSRWFSSPAQQFEYQQTKRALQAALTGGPFTQAIEIGPGDGVWTKDILAVVSDSLHLVEQSEAMYEQAKATLKDEAKVTLERADVMDATVTGEHDLIVAVRCFEYFTEKAAALKKLSQLLAPGGRLVIVTKNADMFTTRSVQDRRLHSDQLSQLQMEQLLQEAGFRVRAVYPATLRFKSKYALSRLVFDGLHRLAVATRGRFSIPVLFRGATESFVYVAEKPQV